MPSLLACSILLATVTSAAAEPKTALALVVDDDKGTPLSWGLATLTVSAP